MTGNPSLTNRRYASVLLLRGAAEMKLMTRADAKSRFEALVRRMNRPFRPPKRAHARG